MLPCFVLNRSHRFNHVHEHELRQGRGRQLHLKTVPAIGEKKSCLRRDSILQHPADCADALAAEPLR